MIQSVVESDTRLVRQVQDRLGKPFFASESCLVYNLDCLEAMTRLPNEAIDLTVTSPPYNIGKEYETLMPLETYLDWCASWMQQIFRLTSPQGAFWLNLGYVSIPDKARGIPIPYLLWDRVPFFLIQEIVWNYGAGVAAKRFFSPRNEKFLWYVKDQDSYTFNLDDIRDPNVKYPNQKKNGKIKVNPLGKNPTDVWEFAKVTSGKNRASKERTSHPAQFPMGVIERIVLASSSQGQLVMDPFMGSGTTAEVALMTGRMVLGFEVNSNYCQIIADRLEDYLSFEDSLKMQPTLLE